MSDLESIVYDFITYEARTRDAEAKLPFSDVKKEELLKIKKLDRK